MASEIRVNTINNSSGLGTITISDTGAVFTGVTTITSLEVSGSLVNVSGVTTVSAGSTSAPSITPVGDPDTGIFFPSANTIAFGEGGAEAARIDSSGRLLVGTSSAVAIGGESAPKLQLVDAGSTSASWFNLARFTNGGGAASIQFGKSRGTTIGDYTVVQNGDILGSLVFAGADGTDLGSYGAQITAEVDGTPGANDMPGRLVFKTTADGTSSPTERMRIDSSGRVGIGTTSPDNNLHIYTDTNGEGILVKSTGNTSNSLDFDANRSSAEGGIAAIRGKWNGTTVAQISFSAGSDTTNKDDGFISFGTESAASNGNANAAEKMRIDSSGRLLVGTSTARSNFFNGSPIGPGFQIEGTGFEGRMAAIISSNSGGSETASLILAHQKSGAVGGNTILASGDAAGRLSFQGSDGSEFVETAYIQAEIDDTPGANDMPGRLVFSTTANSGSSPSERMRITQQGYTKCSNTGQYSGATNTYHESVSNIADWTHYFQNSNGSSPFGIIVRYSAAAPNDTGKEFFYAYDTGGVRFVVRSNGGIANVQSNDANLCDEREKKNIEALDSTWGCLKNWDLKKFHYNEDADTDDKRYGVIAQQVAEHCPEVITDWVKQKAEDAVFDDDGNVVTPAKEEIVRMGVKEQQMMWMAIKALQEAQTRIETLETANASLEARLTALEGQ